MTLAALSPIAKLIVILGAAVLLAWATLAFAVASYGERRGLPFWPLFLCALALGWPLVLLGIVLASGIRARR